MSDTPATAANEVDQDRRGFLTFATVATGAVGAAFVAVPFIASWSPSERARAAGAPVEVDLAKIEPGQMLTIPCAASREVQRGAAIVFVSAPDTRTHKWPRPSSHRRAVTDVYPFRRTGIEKTRLFAAQTGLAAEISAIRW